MYLGAPGVDLNTLSDGDGNNNTTTLCSTPERISQGFTNISTVNNSVNEITMSIAASEIIDGNAELITTNITDPTAHITLGSPFTGTVNFTFAGTAYKCQKIELVGQRSLSFSKSNGSTMTEAEAEQLLDALVYFNSVNSAGLRHFSLWLREDQVTSAYAFFDVYGGCILLTASGSDLEARVNGPEVRLQWTPAEPANVRNWTLERSEAGGPWESVKRGDAQASELSTLMLTDKPGRSGLYFYRVINTDAAGNKWLSPQRSVRLEVPMKPIHIYPNPVSGSSITVFIGQDGPAQLLDMTGRMVWSGELRVGTNKIETGKLQRGVYVLCIGENRSQLMVK